MISISISLSFFKAVHKYQLHTLYFYHGFMEPANVGKMIVTVDVNL